MITKQDLGKRYRDVVNGFEGTAVAVTDWLHGCTRVTLSTMVNGEIKECTFDVPQLDEVSAERHDGTPEVAKTGGGSVHDGPRR